MFTFFKLIVLNSPDFNNPWSISNYKYYSTKKSSNLKINVSEVDLLPSLYLNPTTLQDFDNIRKPNINWTYDKPTYIKLCEIGDDKLSSAVKKFLTNLPSNKVFCLIPLVVDGQYVVSLSRQLLITNIVDHNDLVDFINNKIELLTMKYNFELGNTIMLQVKRVTISKSFELTKFENINDQIKDNSLLTSKAKLESKYMTNEYLPFSMNLNDYGLLIDKNFTYNLETGKLYRYKSTIEIFVREINNQYHVGYVLKKSKVLFKFEDKLHNNIISRNIGSLTLKISSTDNKLLYFEGYINNKLLKPTSRLLVKPSNKIITYDIETYKNNKGVFVPYACGWYNGITTNLYYLTDFNSVEEMLIKSIKDIMVNGNNGYSVYIHNLNGFDGVFLFKILLSKFNAKPLFKNNRLLSVKLSTKSKPTIRIKLLDSLSLLPVNLRLLANEFNVSTKKGNFPYRFVNSNYLNYIGNTPSSDFYELNNEFNLSDYNDMVKDDWNLKDETLKYLTSDLVSLYQVLIIVRDMVYDEFKVDITNSVSISSLVLSIFKSNFLNSSHIYHVLFQILYKDYDL